MVSAPTRSAPSSIGDAAEVCHTRDVDERAGLGQAEGERGEQALAAGQQPGLGARLAPKLKRLGERVRPHIGERRRLHGSSPLPLVVCPLAAGHAAFKGVAQLAPRKYAASGQAATSLHAQTGLRDKPM